MPARPYLASGQSNPGGLLRLALMCLGVALITGVAEGLVSRWISLIILFPAVLGLVVGGVAGHVVAGSHIRAPWMAAGLAAIMGLVAQLSVDGTRYAEFRHELPAEIASQITAQTGHEGFVGYMILRAQAGTEIKKAGQSGSGIKLDGTAYWVFFAVNLLIAAGVAAGMALQRAREPYCESCGKWYDRVAIIGQGSGDKSVVQAVKQTLDRGALGDVQAALGSPRQASSSVLRLRSCSGCTSHEPLLGLVVTTGNAKKQNSRTAYETLIRHDDARRLAEALAPPAQG